MAIQILHLEDSAEDAFLIERALNRNGVEAKILHARDRNEYHTFLDCRRVDLILADSGLPGFSGLEALSLARAKCPDLPFICLSGSMDEKQVAASLDAGADDFVPKDQMPRLVTAVRCAIERSRMVRKNRGMMRLVKAVQELSLARDLETIMAIVRHAARELTGADGATFVLRDGDQCAYADEDAIAPLWKGQRFPMSACVSGWVMMNREPAVIEDIYADPRVLTEAYRPTFVKSMAMVPIRTESPIGAIGNYWAEPHLAEPDEVELLQALANTTAVAMENIRVYAELEERVKLRTAQLQEANQELESFAYAVSHDLGAPLRSIRGFSELILRDKESGLSESAKTYLGRVNAGAQQMRELMDDLLRVSRVGRGDAVFAKVDLTILVREILANLAAADPERAVEIEIAEGIETSGDAGLLRIALENLLGNAWKFTSGTDRARIEFGTTAIAEDSPVYYVRDNGAGFDMQYADKLFQPFRRFHSQEEFPGTGIGLSTVKRVISCHGGRIWAEAETGKGATFYFTLHKAQPA